MEIDKCTSTKKLQWKDLFASGIHICVVIIIVQNDSDKIICKLIKTAICYVLIRPRRGAKKTYFCANQKIFIADFLKLLVAASYS